MKTLLILLSSLLLRAGLFAQRLQGVVSGKVANIKNEAIVSATIRLQPAADSTVGKEMATDQNGQFKFIAVADGAYQLVVSVAGMQPYKSAMFYLDETHKNIVLPAIILTPKSTDLEAVVIKTKRPLLEQEIDRVIVHVDAMISSASSNTLEVLEKTPGITVNSNSEINLNGRGALVLIDGRSTYMSGQDLAAYLKSIPGSTL